jgi:hypothetical protein
MTKTHYIIAIAILVGLAFLAGGMVGTHIERTHHENWFGRYDKSYIKYLEAQNKKVSEHWKECHDELAEVQRPTIYMPKNMEDSMFNVMAQTVKEKERLEKQFEAEKAAALERLRKMLKDAE